MDVIDQDLTGSLFRHVDLTDTRFDDVSLVRVQVRGAYLEDAVLRGST